MQNHQILTVLRVTLFLAILFAVLRSQADAGEAQPESLSTPPQFQGPFYPTALPRDTDNDLVVINESDTAASGEIVHLTGRVLDLDGKPVCNALVELWQTDAEGIYLHHDSPNRSDYDRNFQGFGRVLTGPSGEYYFRTIKPKTHLENRMRRAPHFHLGVYVAERGALFTQVYLADSVLNERDHILNSVSNPEQREMLVRPLAAVEGRPGHSMVTFDIVMRFKSSNGE